MIPSPTISTLFPYTTLFRSRVVVDMVQLNVAVTDSKGNYVTGLRPQDFVVTEDNIKEKIATFGEGNEPTRRLLDIPQAAADRKSTRLNSSHTVISYAVFCLK